MHVTPLRWSHGTGWTFPPSAVTQPVDLVLYFGATDVLVDHAAPLHDLRTAHPRAVCAGTSTAGEIFGSSVSDGTLSALLIHFDRTRVRGVSAPVATAADSAAAGAELGRQLASPDLRHVLVFSDGLVVNGSALTASLRAHLPAGVQATGGLAGDGPHFRRTTVGLGDHLGSGQVVAVGFYGPEFRVAYGSAGGWQPFGPKRQITHAKGNVLYRLDDQPALALYKRYLGDRAHGLPATGLLFPLQLLADATASSGLARTILAIDEDAQSLTFAGDMPIGHYARLMKAGCDALVDGAGSAASLALGQSEISGPRAAVLVSCVGRKLVLGQRVEEELEAVFARLGSGVHAAGFYSYGEISPAGLTHGCELHNQTMTLTVFAEAP